MSTFAPTPEQQAVIDAFNFGHVVTIARAGTGKTSTCVALAEANPHLTFAYIAFNKAMATEAAAKMPANVTAKTAHAFAYAAVGRLYRDRMNRTERVPLKDVTKFLGLYNDLQCGQRRLSPYNQARIVSDMVTKFCKSADKEIETYHLAAVEGVEKWDRPLLAKAMLPYARKAWADLQKTEGGTLRFTHDHYLKMWQLGDPVLAYDAIIFDEAQDANPVIEAVIMAQVARGVRLNIVGDPAQAIYGWNGAIDAMTKFAKQDGVQVRYLTQSFRFGEAIAEVGNRWLAMLNDGGQMVRGLDSLDSTVGDLPAPKALLTRTNAGAVRAALDMQSAGHDVHLVGGAADLEGFARGSLELQTKRWTSHKDLSIFKSWSEVQAFVKDDPDGTDLAALVRLVDEHGAQEILNVLQQCVAEKHADVVISTAHKSKGREWSSVKIHADFEQKKEKDGTPIPLSDEEIMLRYVAVTRAKKTLDPGPLATPVAAAA